MIISVVAAKIWYLKNVQFFIGPPCTSCLCDCWNVIGALQMYDVTYLTSYI